MPEKLGGFGISREKVKRDSKPLFPEIYEGSKPKILPETKE